jgi:CBS domain-containing protein
MSRREEYLESMLRDLGSVYYQTLQGEASEADVAKAVESVRAHHADRAAGEARTAPPQRGKWRVSDVMRRDVVWIDKNTPVKQVARLLVEEDVSAVPVLSGGGRVLGMVSEADVLRRNERSFRRLGAGLRRRTHHERQQAQAVTAGELMNSPAITIHPDAPLGAAARLMNGHRLRWLPVVDPAGELIGIVSRRDLLRAFLRPDSEIAEEVAAALAALAGPDAVTATVTEGEVTLAGSVRKAELIGACERVTSEVDGVVTVICGLRAGEPAGRAG